MTITFTVPAHLQGRPVDQLLDASAAAAPRGSQPTGVLGTTITLALPYAKQAYDLGMTFSSWTPG